jgi:hypothetical protein
MTLMFNVMNGALHLMQNGPGPLGRALAASAEINGYDSSSPTLHSLKRQLADGSPGEHLVVAFRSALARWDNAHDGDWTAGTKQNCADRRALIYSRLKLDRDFITLCDQKFPFKELDLPTLIAVEHVPWYDETIRKAHSYYWTAYSKQLLRQGWQEDSVRQLDDSTTRIVERLADPSSEAAYQAKGLVVGYVQSGKTANFTGVIAKAADAGYKLIVIMAGTLDVLRSQTQRRVDKELIGQELLDKEYAHHADWDSFLKHGAKPSALGAFDWYRLTGSESDYQKLGRGVEALQFEAPHATKPLWHKDNLFQTRTRVAVVKKNPAVLKRLLGDLRLLQRRGIGAPLDQIPALVIDDESDQASINVRVAEGSATPTNEAIVGLLRVLPRAQYVGYTATPFANVFVDPADEADIFPKDFLLSLPRPSGYMGVSDFYDLEGTADDPDTRPNERDFVRSVVGLDTAEDNLAKAIDSFVLSGALKIYRASKGSGLKLRHHTMLAHASSLMADHDQLAQVIRSVLGAAAYEAKKGRARLKKLLETDFARVSADRGQGLPFPSNFDELAPYVGDCLAAIGEPSDAVLILNTENKEQTPDFDRESIWKILIGGNKLSRGYTVEGLTISYYRRRARTADTLMQMGRWFGFREGYGDLVRLFIGTDEPLDKKGRKRINLYAAYGAVCRDEEAFRLELKRYANLEKRITPLQVPPLVPSHMLRPTAPNKMFNARITYMNFGGQLSESTFAPDREEDVRHNHRALLKLIDDGDIKSDILEATVEGKVIRFAARTVILKPQAMVEFLDAYRWSNSDIKSKLRPMELQLEFLQGAGKRDPRISDWIMIAPQIASPKDKLVIKEQEFGVVYRERTGNRYSTYNDPRHRAFGADIAYEKDLPNANENLKALRQKGRGVMLYYPITPENRRGKKAKPPYSTGFTLLFPRNNIASPISFVVRRPDLSNRPTVTVS